jgi:hypothetical protein
MCAARSWITWNKSTAINQLEWKLISIKEPIAKDINVAKAVDNNALRKERLAKKSKVS